jgi:hypothetical protein
MGDDQTMVLAMPRRELFRIAGFSRTIDFAVLDSLAEESWFAAPPALRDNFDAKEVRLGVILMRRDGEQDQALVSESGVLLHATPIPPEVGTMGRGLRALRKLALGAGSQLMASPGGQIELIGYCNDEALPECRLFFILVYRMRVPPATPAPAEMSWISTNHLHGVPLDPVSAMIAAQLSG